LKEAFEAEKKLRIDAPVIKTAPPPAK